MKSPTPDSSGHLTNSGGHLSLHGMTPEEAIKKMFSAPQERTVICEKCGEQPLSGLGIIDEEGNTRCPKCGLIATIKPA